MAEPNIVKGFENKAKAVAWYDGDKSPDIVPCPKQVLDLLLAPAIGGPDGGREGNWKWEELALKVLASSYCGLAGHARLDDASNHAGRALRGQYQKVDLWNDAFGPSNSVSQHRADEMYAIIRHEAWYTIKHRSSSQPKAKGKAKGKALALPTL